MSEIDDGGPAFPTAQFDCEIGERVVSGGMTLRDYFAAKWLQGYISSPVAVDIHYSEAARYSYEIADAMLKARQS